MKILITTPIFPPENRGPATYTFELCQRLPSKVITFTQNPVRVNGVPVYSVLVSGGAILRQGRLLAKILEWSRGTDIIFAQGADVVGFASCIAGKILGKPVVIKCVGDLPIEMARDFGQNGLTIKLLRLITLISLHLANKIIFPADHLRKTIIESYKINPAKTVVIYNAI